MKLDALPVRYRSKIKTIMKLDALRCGLAARCEAGLCPAVSKST